MLAKQDYLDIANTILKSDWDECEQIKCGRFTISQFQGTAFDSDYMCYKISWEEKDTTSLPKTGTVVAKITIENELKALSLAKEKKLLVPDIDAHIRLKEGRILVFEQFLDGKELYSSAESNDWMKTACKLADLHLAYWKIDECYPKIAATFQVSKSITDRIRVAINNTSHRSVWRNFASKVCVRIDDLPKTLAHGDCFPTNILVNGTDVGFIDWANASAFAYITDIARLTAIIDMKTYKPMCPCVNEVLEIYYDRMKSKLSISYDEYLRDIHMAQFIELGACFSPRIFYGVDQHYNNIIDQKLMDIALAYR